MSEYMRVQQFGGASYDDSDYPFVLIDKSNDSVVGRFSTLDKAHSGRLAHVLNHQDDIILLFDVRNNSFVDWDTKERRLFEQFKDEPSEFFMRKRS